MKSLEEATNHFYDEIYPNISYLEDERKDVAGKIVILRLYTVVLTFVLWINLYLLNLVGWLDENLDMAFGLSIALPAAIYTVIHKMTISDYKIKFKDRIIENIICFIEPDLRYQKNKFIPQKKFIGSEIFKKSIDRYSGNDYVNGAIHNTEIEFSDIHAEYKVKTKNSTHWQTIFQGLFFVADFHKDFQYTMVVLPDFAQIDTFLHNINLNRDDLIKPDNPEFEKEFVVYGDDQAESRYLLTHAMMQRILEFKHKSNKNIFLSFKESKIYIAIEYNKDLFEPDPFVSLKDFETIKEYYETLALVIDIVDDFKLNRRIWSKE